MEVLKSKNEGGCISVGKKEKHLDKEFKKNLKVIDTINSMELLNYTMVLKKYGTFSNDELIIKPM